MQMLERNYIPFLGSDCHNMTSRPPKLDNVRKIILQRFGDKVFDERWQDPRRIRVTDEVFAL